MKIFTAMNEHNHEEVVFCNDRDTGLRAIIAIHDTTLGPALGGTRMWPYKSEEEALHDVLRLARGMTYKSAAAGLNFGGGKAVIIGDPHRDKNEMLFRAFGRFVQGFSGRFITGEDVGVEVKDMEWVRMETPWVLGISEALGGSGDPSPVTARGVYFGLKAACEAVFDTPSLKGRKVAIQGAGHVGYYLADFLNREGATLFVSDIRNERVNRCVEEFGATAVAPDKIYDVDADIFSPCALGAIINDETIPRLKVKVIAGGANNQLADEQKHGRILMEKRILYAPDYVINAGGLINVANEIEGYHRDKALKEAEGIYGVLKQIILIAHKENIPTCEASNRLAEHRLAQVAKLKRMHVLSRPRQIRGERYAW
ncbi:Glu/Leu/Phe/Val dehydrogenase [candidate division KSB1 bacterium]|nr:MAG: Glu/Leu/Phe/Val dehydrogenase [candidate division KSB1 bacterium]MBC6949391.1 Glu/Leu/Phe/Val dehydrogenase [candidate division KSB1 bacterium]MCE7940787.1 Glu/Leu/Phe/Val dehydrogenase [Chlorobi bacterium CHB1]MDL1874173.1 Glu/Leu/Phe/Val dehydrogenase [Cytophagia bacterium CHB2]